MKLEATSYWRGATAARRTRTDCSGGSPLCAQAAGIFPKQEVPARGGDFARCWDPAFCFSSSGVALLFPTQTVGIFYHDSVAAFQRTAASVLCQLRTAWKVHEALPHGQKNPQPNLYLAILGNEWKTDFRLQLLCREYTYTYRGHFLSHESYPNKHPHL